MTSAGGRRDGRDSPWQAADGDLGRVVTWPSPDAFVLVNGVMLRALPPGGGVLPGAEVRLRFDAERQRLLAVTPDQTRGEGPDEGPGERGPSGT